MFFSILAVSWYVLFSQPLYIEYSEFFVTSYPHLPFEIFYHILLSNIYFTYVVQISKLGKFGMGNKFFY